MKPARLQLSQSNQSLEVSGSGSSNGQRPTLSAETSPVDAQQLHQLSISSSNSASNSADNISTGSSNTMPTPRQKRPRPKPINLGQMGITSNSLAVSLSAPLAAVEPVTAAAISTSVSATTSATVTAPSQHSLSMASLVQPNQQLHIKDLDLEVMQELGMGAGGTVYKVTHRPTRTVMAKKIIHQQMDQESLKNEIAKELKILGECQSPYIISFYGAYVNQGELCICIEFMDVGSLERVSKINGPLNELILGKVTMSILNGLDYLYTKHRIVHRDIKPSNVLINSQGRVKLCDFGVSGQMESSIANTFVGTGAYMSPERIQGQQYSTQSDTWGMGLTLLELALGYYPFLPESKRDSGEEAIAAMSPFDLLSYIVNDPVPQLPADRYSPVFQSFLASCLLKDAKARPSPSRLLGTGGDRHALVEQAERSSVDMVAFAMQFLEPNLNAKQAQRWSVSQQRKRTSLLQQMPPAQRDKRKSMLPPKKK